jgi:hypothetical protein
MNGGWSVPRLGAAALVLATLATGTALAVPIPPSVFTFDVTQGNVLLPECTRFIGSPNGGTCGSESSGPGYAATSGGIGTASYLPVTPGGTVLGPGTAVDAISTWSSGAGVRSAATITYSFEATGPASVKFIPIDVLSTGLTAAAGNSTSFVSLVIRDSGTDANIPPGVPDPDPPGALLDLTAECSHGKCFSPWDGHQLTDMFCVVNGDNYVVTVTALTSAAAGRMKDSASAQLDPVIKLDPPYPKSCPVDVSPNLLKVRTGPGASTGVAAPEPSGLSLAVIAMLGLAVFGRARRGRAQLVRRAVRDARAAAAPCRARSRSADRT